MKKIKIIQLLYYLIGVIILVVFSSCDENVTTNTAATCRLDTSYYQLRHFYCQYQYLILNGLNHKIFNDDTYKKMETAFDAGRVTLKVNVASTDYIYDAFTSYDTAHINTFYRSAFLYGQNHYVSNNYYRDGYIFGIDSAHNHFSDTNLLKIQGTTVWNSGKTEIYTLIFVDKLMNPIYQNDSAALEAAATHELGHYLGIESHEEGCSSCGIQNCIMRGNLTSYMYNDVHFCGRHLSLLWDGAQHGSTASGRIINIPFRKTSNRNFSFSITMKDSVFLQCLPVNVTLKVKNLSSAKDTIAQILGEEDIIVKNEFGKKLKSCISTLYSSTPYWSFESGEEKTINFDIELFFGGPFTSNINGCIPPGTYYVVIEKHGIVSNELTFTVVKPEGQDLNDITELLTAIKRPNNPINEEILRSNLRFKIDKLYNFLNKYPDSRYYELGLSEYVLNIGTNTNFVSSTDYINLIDVTKPWFKKDSESEFAKELISVLSSVNKTAFIEAKNEIKEYLNKIEIEYPETVISRWAKAYLEKF